MKCAGNNIIYILYVFSRKHLHCWFSVKKCIRPAKATTIIPKKQKSLTFQTIKNQPPRKQQAKQGSLGKWLLK